MALLGENWDDPKTAALLALAGGMTQGNLGAGLLGMNQAYQATKEGQLKGLLAKQQLDLGNMTMEEQRRKLTDEAASRQVLTDFYKNRGMPGATAPAAPVGGPTGAVNSALPPEFQIGALPATPGFQAQQPGGVTPKAEVWKQYQQLGDALSAGGHIEKAQQYYGLAEKMRPKYSTTPQVVRGPDGKLINVLIGEDGTTTPMQYGVKPDMVLENLGGTTRAIDKNSLNGGESFTKTMTPGEVASNTLGWANNSATLRGQNMTDARSREANTLGRLPAGYRQKADGSGQLEYIPGGPADPNAAKKAAPTEFQGKSATFGARAQESDKILSSLEGQYSPSAVNSKVGAASIPMIGGIMEPIGNALMSANAQKAEQAQRDFVNAVLRQESGAAISAGEFENARKQYFPQPFDSAEVKKQKARNRQIVIQGFLANSRPGQMEAVGAGRAGAETTGPDNDPLGLRK